MNRLLPNFGSFDSLLPRLHPVLLALGLALALSGCRQASEKPSVETPAAETPTAETPAAGAPAAGAPAAATPTGPTPAAGTAASAADLLRETIQRYQRAEHYADRGQLRLEYDEAGQSTVDTAQIVVNFTRPNRLQLSIVRGINRLRLVSDGQRLRVAVEDPISQDLRHQVVQRATPAQLTVREVYAATELLDPANPREMLSVLMGLPLDLYVSQLGLLLPGSALLNLCNRSSAIQTLADETLDGVRCTRIELQDGSGKFVFWIDPTTRLLRRIEYPTDALFQSVPAEQRPQNPRLALDLQEASLAAVDGSAFVWPSQEDVRWVQYFVLPPLPLPSERFGEPIPAMTFVDLAGGTQSTQGWAGTIQVFVWFDNQPASRTALSRIERIYRLYADRGEPVVFRAVCVQSADQLDADALRHLVSQWGTTLPLLRDVHAAGRDSLAVERAPTVAVLDGASRLQMYEVGANPQLDESLQIVLGRLLAGENVGADVKARWRASDQRFEQFLQMAAVEGDPQSLDKLPGLAAAAGFRKLPSSIAWQTDRVPSAGDLLLDRSTQSATPRLNVLSGMQHLLQLDAMGQIVARQRLDLDEDAFVSQLRQRIDGQGNPYYVGFAPLGRHVYVFDRELRRVLEYPPAEQTHNGVMDADLWDLDRDGTLELYIAFAAPHGCQRVDLEGRRIWSNRVLPTTISLVPRWQAGPPHLLATGDQGWLLPISPAGREGSPVTVGQRTIHQLAARDSGDTPEGADSGEQTQPRAAPFLGISYSLEGRLIAVGLNMKLEEQWSYELPAGLFRHPVRAAQWVPLFGPALGCWLLPGPDGSVHVIRDDGSFFDRLDTGQHVLGLAGHPQGDVGRLYVATEGKVTAYDLRQPEP